MQDNLTAAERYALGLWAAWYLEKHSRLTDDDDPTVLDTRVAWHVREMVAELRALAQVKGRDLEIPNPLFFRDLLEALADLEVSPADFFAGVVQRWYGSSSHDSN